MSCVKEVTISQCAEELIITNELFDPSVDYVLRVQNFNSMYDIAAVHTTDGDNEILTFDLTELPEGLLSTGLEFTCVLLANDTITTIQLDTIYDYVLLYVKDIQPIQTSFIIS